MKAFARTILLTSLVWPLVPFAAESAADDLVHLEIHEPPQPGGKPLDMRVDEVERAASFSLVDVDFRSGGSVASSMFVLKAVCAVARARHADYFLSEPVAAPGTRYRVTFPKDASGPTIDLPHREGETARTMPAAMSIAQCRLVGF